MELFTIKDLSFTYPGQGDKALNQINLNIPMGEFIVICGRSGSGKSTLLKHFKPALTPFGEKEGSFLYEGQEVGELEERKQAAEIGFVLQNPENQIVTDKVWHELAFGLENLGYENAAIRLRVAEMASYFGIQHWFHRKVMDLSGGQKQLLSLAAVMAMGPRVLILDEPVAQLDPIAASDFIRMIKKINTDLGITIIMTEQRLEEIIPAADRLIVMDQGRIILEDTPKKVGALLKDMDHRMFLAMPSPMQIYGQVRSEGECPLTVKEGRAWLQKHLAHRMHQDIEPIEKKSSSRGKEEWAISAKDVWFRYEKKEEDIIKSLTLQIKKGITTAIMGGNGTGKSTMLSLITGANKPYRGKIRFMRNHPPSIAMLSQSPLSLFVESTVDLDWQEVCKDAKRREEMACLMGLEHLLQRHPYDLSGGELQRAALAKVLLLESSILLLDEPTKGMDAEFKVIFGGILRKCKEEGKTIVMVSHDIEFCASNAEETALFFDGNIISVANTREFFAGNSFYTTAANRMARDFNDQIITNEDVVKLCQM